MPKYYADSLAFLALQGQSPIFDPLKRPSLSLAHVTSVPPFVKDFDATFAAHCVFRKQAMANPFTYVVRTKADLNANNKAGTGILFGMQHAPDGLTFKRLQQLSDAGVRIMALAYDGVNDYGSGSRAYGGLSKKGMELLEWMSECRIIPDLSHLNHETALDVLDFIDIAGIKLYPMASHSACYSFYPHPRNLSDELIKRIVSLKGYVGIPAITFFLAREGSEYLETVVSHIGWAIHLGSNQNVGIGSDCIHADMTMEQAKTHFANMTMMLKTEGALGEYFPDRPPEFIERGSQLFEILEKTLLSRGFAQHTVSNLCGENFKTFLGHSLPRT